MASRERTETEAVANLEKMEAFVEELRAWQKEMVACQEVTEACVEKTKATPENSKSSLEEMEAALDVFEDVLKKMEAADLEANPEATGASVEQQELCIGGPIWGPAYVRKAPPTAEDTIVYRGRSWLPSEDG